MFNCCSECHILLQEQSKLKGSILVQSLKKCVWPSCVKHATKLSFFPAHHVQSATALGRFTIMSKSVHQFINSYPPVRSPLVHRSKTSMPEQPKTDAGDPTHYRHWRNDRCSFLIFDSQHLEYFPATTHSATWCFRVGYQLHNYILSALRRLTKNSSQTKVM